MARRFRQDLPASWQHVINRGLAKRPLFEDRIDIRFFLSRLAREVRRGRLELHSWCVLTTHFHLLVRSPVGELSEALRRSQNEYSRCFNRRHKESRILSRQRGGDDLDDLVGSAPPQVLAWMKRKTKLADGGRIGLPAREARSIRHAV
jgi:REP element-mobilizing transposase RayT